MRKILSWFNNAKIFYKLLASFLILLILTVVVLSTLIFSLSENIVGQKTNQYVQDVLFQANKQIEFNMERVIEIVHGLCFNVEGIQEPARAANRGYQSEAHERLVQQTAENAIFFAIMQRSEMEIVTVVTDAGDAFSVNKMGIVYPLDAIQKQDLYDAKGSILWYPPTTELPFLTAACALNDLVTQKPIGYVIACINPDYFLKIFNNIQLAQGEEAFLVETGGKIILHDGYRMELPPRSLGLTNFEGMGFAPVHYQGRNCYVAHLQIKNSQWSLVSILPASEFEKSVKALLSDTVFVAAFVILIDILLSYFIARGIANPIRKMIPALEKIGQGDFTIQVKQNTGDEVGMLARTINKMTRDIQDLIDIAYRAQILRQQSELKALQMQISPHFLYNTLDSINWLARANGVNEVGQMAKSLADLMRATVGKSDFITVQEELGMIQSYLSIQKIRYESRLVATMSIQEELMDMYMPKLILQPILENAFVHGIDNKIGVGHITISGDLQENMLVFEIRDDGIGISREKQKEMFGQAALDRQESGEHIGVANVDKRLKLYYGEGYGVTVESEVNVGTSVTITLPRQESAENKLQCKEQENGE